MDKSQKQKQGVKSQKITDFVRPAPGKRSRPDAESGEENSSDDAQATSQGVTHLITLESINKKLDKLNMLDLMMEELTSLKESLEFSQEQIGELVKDNAEMKGKMEFMETRFDLIEAENKKLKEALLDVQCRSMRDNIVFTGLPEKEGKDCETVIREFMSDQLNLPTATVQGITFSRVHRMGRPSKDRPRAIVARFEHYQHKELVKGRGRELRNTTFGMNDQFPPEINYRRKVLIPIMKEHRSQSTRVALVVDRLYINNQLFRDSSITPWLF